MKKRSIIVFILLIGISYILSRSIEVSNIPQPLYIGQQIDIELDLSAYAPERVFFLGERSISRLEVIALEEISHRPYHYLLRIAAFDTGYVETDRFPLYLAGSSVAESLFVEPFRFFVRSSLTPADTLLKDIAQPIRYRLKFFDYAVPILIILVLIALIYYIMKKLKGKTKEEYVFVDNRPAWLIVMELLKEFKQKRYLENGQYLEYYFDLSLIFRIFIEKQFNIKAAEMTTYEIKQALPNIDKKKDILKILSTMDMIKYAKTMPVIKEAEEKLYWIEKYVMSFSLDNKEVKDV